MKRLSELHPAFYPQPTIESPGRGPIRAEFSPFNGDYLTKADLIALVGRCGSVLHQGTYKRLLTKKQPIKLSHPEIQKMVTKITNLLRFHTVSLIKPGKLYVCHYLADDRVQVFSAAKVESTVP
jgi:hypothetical protein